MQNVEQKNDKIISLDDERDDTIYFKHESSDDVYEIPKKIIKPGTFLHATIIDNDVDDYGLSHNNPIILKEIVPITLPFIVEYLIHCGGDETPSPETPLKDLHISHILGDEYQLFHNMCNIADERAKISVVNTHIIAAMYFGFSELVRKLCAIIANTLKLLSMDEIRAILGTKDEQKQ